MNNAPSQFPLRLPVDPQLDRDSFLVGESNSEAAALVDDWAAWSGPFAIIVGPTGAGKTHIAEIWRARSDALAMSADDIGQDVKLVNAHILIDDVVPGMIDEAGLFHLLNAARQNSKTVLMTSRDRPAAWRIVTPDLLSRLRSATTVEIGEPDDSLLKAVMVKLFADRQIAVEAGVINYIAMRMERSLRTAIAVVDTLDHLSLARKSRITKALAADVLKSVETRALS